MNIMFTKKITAFIIALIMIIGIAMPSFAKIDKNNLFSADDINKVLKSGGLDKDTKEALETVLEAMNAGIPIERGRKIYDSNEKLAEVNLKEKAVKVTNLVITDTDMLLEIEYDSKKGYINIADEVKEEDAIKVEEQIAKEQAEKEEAERIAREQAEKEEAERIAREQAEKEEAERIAREQAEKEEAERIAREQAEKEAEEQSKEQEDIEIVILNDDDNKEEISEEVPEEPKEEKDITSEDVKEENEEKTPSILEKLKGASGLFNKLLPIIQNIMRTIAQALRNRLNELFKYAF